MATDSKTRSDRNNDWGGGLSSLKLNRTAENLDGRLICPSVRTHRRPKVYLGQTCVPTFKQLEIRKSSDR